MEFNDGEPVGSEYIFGDTSPSSSDYEPTEQTKTSISVGFRKVASDFDFKALTAKVRAQTLRPVEPISASISSTDRHLAIGRPVTYTEIPDGESRAHPLYGFNPDNYTEESSPERKAEGELDVENVIDIDPEELDRIETLADDMAGEVSELLLTEGAALLMSFDDATAKAEAVLRDGMDITAEMDTTVADALSHMMRLNILSKYMERMSMPDTLKSKFMNLMTEKIAGDAHGAMTKTTANAKYRAVLDNLQGRVKPRDPQSQPNASKDGSVVAGPMGVVRHKGSGSGIAPPSSDSVDDTHGFNERQNAGVRVK